MMKALLKLPKHNSTYTGELLHDITVLDINNNFGVCGTHTRKISMLLPSEIEILPRRYSAC